MRRLGLSTTTLACAGVRPGMDAVRIDSPFCRPEIMKQALAPEDWLVVTTDAGVLHTVPSTQPTAIDSPPTLLDLRLTISSRLVPRPTYAVGWLKVRSSCVTVIRSDSTTVPSGSCARTR